MEISSEPKFELKGHLPLKVERSQEQGHVTGRVLWVIFLAEIFLERSKLVNMSGSKRQHGAFLERVGKRENKALCAGHFIG